MSSTIYDMALHQCGFNDKDFISGQVSLFETSVRIPLEMSKKEGSQAIVANA
jgi:hypothetical protein